MSEQIRVPTERNTASDCARLSTYFALVNLGLRESYPSLEEIRNSFGLESTDATPTDIVVQKLKEAGANVNYFSSFPYEKLAALDDDELMELAKNYNADGNFTFEQLKSQINYFNIPGNTSCDLAKMTSEELILFFNNVIESDGLIFMQININHMVVVFNHFPDGGADYVEYYDPNELEGPISLTWDEFIKKKWDKDLLVGDFPVNFREAIVVTKPPNIL